MPFSLIAWDQSHLASGLAFILLATTPLFTVVVAHFLTPKIAASIIGVVVLIGPTALDGPRFPLLAHIGLLGATLFYAFSGVYGLRFQRLGVTSLATATCQIIASSILLLPVALAVDRPWVLGMPDGGTWLAIAGLALLSTSLAYILYFPTLATAGAANLLLVACLIPMSTIILGAAILAEHLKVNHFIGIVVIGIRLGAIDVRILKLVPRLWDRA